MYTPPRGSISIVTKVPPTTELCAWLVVAVTRGSAYVFSELIVQKILWHDGVAVKV